MNQSQSKEVLSSEQKFQRKLLVVRISLSQGTQAAVLRSGVPERTVRRWKAAFKKAQIDGLREKSRKPRHSPGRKDTNGVLARALARLDHEEPGLLRVQVLAKLLQEDSLDHPTITWIARTRKRLGLTRKKTHRPATHTKRYEIFEPGALQIDTKIIDKDGEPGEKLVQFTAIDECSRVRFLSGSLFKSAASAALFVRDAATFFRSLGVEIWRVQTDHGTEFTLPENEATLASFARGQTEEALFTRTCHELGIKHRLITARTPQLNGKVERSHRTDEDRFYSRFRFASYLALDHALKNVWMPEYNDLRPHSSLGGMTPTDFLKKRLREITEKKAKDSVPASEEKIAA
jgi:transposase InsO family protein